MPIIIEIKSFTRPHRCWWRLSETKRADDQFIPLKMSPTVEKVLNMNPTKLFCHRNGNTVTILLSPKPSPKSLSPLFSWLTDRWNIENLHRLFVCVFLLYFKYSKIQKSFPGWFEIIQSALYDLKNLFKRRLLGQILIMIMNFRSSIEIEKVLHPQHEVLRFDLGMRSWIKRRSRGKCREELSYCWAQ